jgi:hypothetical protein
MAVQAPCQIVIGCDRRCCLVPRRRTEVGERIVLPVAAETKVRNRSASGDRKQQRQVDVVRTNRDVAVHALNIGAVNAWPDGEFVEQRRLQGAGEVNREIPAGLPVGAATGDLQRPEALDPEGTHRSGLRVLIIDIAGKDAFGRRNLVVDATDVLGTGVG